MFKAFAIGLGVTVILVAVIGGMWACGVVLNYGSRTAQVVGEQIDPAALLAKYEWFKDAHAKLEAQKANLSVKGEQLKRLEAREQAGALDRTNREQLFVMEEEFSGLKAAYNNLASDYNSQMAKINYRFCNVGGLPQGATEPLPREYAPYEEK